MRKLCILATIGCLLATTVWAKKPVNNRLVKKINYAINHVPRSPMIQILPKLQQNICTALAIYYESRNISDYEKFLVVQTIKNREEKYNLSACQVLAQPGQFPWVRRLNNLTHLSDNQAWLHAQTMAITTRYTNTYRKPNCNIEYFSVGMYSSHRRNLLCSVHFPGHYYYALRN